MHVSNAAEHTKALELLGKDPEEEGSLIFEDRLRLALEAVKYEQKSAIPDGILAMDAQAMCC